MLPGPIILRRCSECSQLIEQFTLLSGNTFGARFWSDGKVNAPMLPDRPWLIECPHCQALLWIDEQEWFGALHTNGKRDKSNGSRPSRTPTTEDYFSMLKHVTLDSKKMRYLRFRAWWSANDSRRGAHVKRVMSDDETKNLEALSDLLDETDPNDRLTKAEIMRELGCFNVASDLLKEQFDDRLSRTAAIIRELVKKKDRYVARLKLD